MKLDVKASSLRWFIFSLNVIFFLLGFAFVAAGFAVKLREELINGPLLHILKEVNISKNGATIADILVTLSNLFIAIGSAGLAVSLIGCCGSVCRWRICLIIYGIDLVIIVVVTVVSMVLAWSLGSGKLAYLEGLLRNSLNQTYRKSDSFDMTKSWDFFFYAFGCCGVTSFRDFKELSSWNRTAIGGSHYNTTLTVQTPLFCCKDVESFTNLVPPKGDEMWSCATHPTDQNSNFNTGCAKKLSTLVKEYSTTLFILGGMNVLVMGGCGGSSILLFVLMGRRRHHEEIDPGELL